MTGLEVVLEIRGGWLGACFEICGAWVWIPSASTSHNGGMWKSSHPNPTTALNCSHWNPNLDHIITACKELQKPNFCTQKLANIIHIWPQKLTFAGKPRITKKIHKPLFWVQSWKLSLHIIIIGIPILFFCSETWIWFSPTCTHSPRLEVVLIRIVQPIQKWALD